MAANGISTLATKAARQVAKLELAKTNRAASGRASEYNIDDLPTKYGADNLPGSLIDNANPTGLLPRRPWTGVGVVAAPTSITQSVTSETLVNLESWFDGADGNAFIPGSPADGDTFTQWTDKSNFAHNANPYGGALTRASYETNELNSLSVVRFDGNDGLTINPYAGIVNAPAITIFSVAKLAATADFPRIYAQAQSFDMFYSTDINAFRFNVNGTVVDSTGADDGNFHIHTVAFDGTQGTNATRFKYRRDKADNGLTFSDTAPTTIGATSQLDIGFSSVTSSNFLTGDIAEILIFTKALSATEIANVENYLSNKWGL